MRLFALGEVSRHVYDGGREEAKTGVGLYSGAVGGGFHEFLYHLIVRVPHVLSGLNLDV